MSQMTSEKAIMPLESFFGFFIFEEFFRFRFLKGERRAVFGGFCSNSMPPYLASKYNRMRSERKAGKETGERGGVDTAGVEGVSVFVTLFFFFFFPLLPLRESTHRKRGAPGPLAASSLPGVLGHLSSLMRAEGETSESEKPRLERKKWLRAGVFFLFESGFFFQISFSLNEKKKETKHPSRPPPPPFSRKRSALSIE